jgi:hypothetical protein
MSLIVLRSGNSCREKKEKKEKRSREPQDPTLLLITKDHLNLLESKMTRPINSKKSHG